MNSVQLIGRLVRDPDVRYTTDSKAVAKFTVAVDRAYQKDKEKQADFISCVAFGKTGEILERYFTKGMKIALIGRIQTGSYKDKEDRTIYTTEVVAERIEFVEKKNDSSNNNIPEGFSQIEDDDDMPF